MASNQSQGANGGGGEGTGRPRAPEWADGLKQLYDSVVEEALPDSFKDLLDRLDSVPPPRGPRGGEEAGT
jgi:hypothetical protein